MNSRQLVPLLSVLLFAGVLAWMMNFAWNTQAPDIAWTDFKRKVEAGELDTVRISENEVYGRVKGAPTGTPQWVTAHRVHGETELLPLAEKYGLEVRAEGVGCNALDAAMVFLVALAIGVTGFVLFRRDPGRGVATFGRSQAKLVPEEGTGITFEDVAGVEEAAVELREIVAFLKTPDKFTTLGGRPPKGVLLVGPPGTGKTLLARAVAGEAGCPFLSISGSDFVEMFVGVGAARVRDLFRTAIAHAPCIVFIDELDAVGKTRGAGGPGGNDEREQTLNQLLVEMDGFDNRRGIIVMAATNRPEILDPALLRPGRFDRQVQVDRPDLAARIKILAVHAKKVKLAADVSLEEVAQLTPGFAGADLANALNEAALLGARRDADAISMSDVKEAIERVAFGLEKKSMRLSPQDKKVTAFHECGHAIVGAASKGGGPVTKITIIPRGFALGYTQYLPEERYSQTRSDLLDLITRLYGGRAAEEIVFGDVSVGAQDDIRRATDIARRMVTVWGMSKTLGPVDYASERQTAFGYAMPEGGPRSPETAEVIEREVRAILERCHTAPSESCSTIARCSTR